MRRPGLDPFAFPQTSVVLTEYLPDHDDKHHACAGISRDAGPIDMDIELNGRPGYSSESLASVPIGFSTNHLIA
jgi:hypothetical protein